MKNVILAFSFLLCFSAQAVSLSPLTNVVPANNDVGAVFMDEVTKSEIARGEKNIMTSPVSLYIALSLAYNGAAGNTSDALGAYLNDNSTSKDDFNSTNQELVKALVAEAKPPAWDGAPASPVLGIYNSAWQSTAVSPSGGFFKFSQNYVDTLEKYYDAEVQGLDFLNPASADVINQWADTKTQGLIPQVISADALSKMSWVLMNATYFQGSWQESFYKISAANSPAFTLVDGSQVQLPTIRNTGYYAYAKSAVAETIAIPFYDADIAFYVVAPNSLKNFEKLRKDTVSQKGFWVSVISDLGKVNTERGELSLPSFEFKYSVELKKDDPLTVATGLQFLYEDIANFSALSAPGSVPTAVGLIKQDTKIVLDENGVKAAAVTTIGGIETTSMPEPPTFNMVVDKPFFFAIASKSTGAVLFVGSVVNPGLKQ